MDVGDGSDVQVRCSAAGDPKPQITWKRMTGMSEKRHQTDFNSCHRQRVDRDRVADIRVIAAEECAAEGQRDIQLLSGKRDRD